MARLAGRVVANALVGGLIFAVVAAFCLGLGGALTGWILNPATNSGDHYALIGAKMGVAQGVVSGVVGALIYAVIAFKTAPGRCFEPLFAGLSWVAAGQIGGVLIAATAFFAVELAKSQLQSRPFDQAVGGDVMFIFLGAPALMVCGAIAGALSKRIKPKTAALAEVVN